MWTGWTGAMHSDVSLRYWGTEEEFEGPNAVMLPGYQKIVNWSGERIKKGFGEIVLGECVERITDHKGKSKHALISFRRS